jgi:hypothetical protein
VKHLSLFVLAVLASSSMLFAQGPSGEFRLYYQTIRDFNYNSGAPGLTFQNDSFNGGGFGFVYDLNPRFGIYSDTTFLRGPEEGGIKLNLINQVQGAKVTAREIGPLNVYAKGGIGFARFIFSAAGSDLGVFWQTNFDLAGGVDFELRDGFFFYIEAKRMVMSLPRLTNAPDRDKWNGSLGLASGIAFRF